CALIAVNRSMKFCNNIIFQTKTQIDVQPDKTTQQIQIQKVIKQGERENKSFYYLLT
ncbi:MAG: hypothetical protein ACI8RD_014385, partial [Bacillariaceae sp.]